MTPSHLIPAIIGIALSLVAVWLSRISRHVLPLEFARTQADVSRIFQNAGPDAVAAAQRAVRVDFVFLVLYGAFLAVFAAQVALGGTPMLWVGVAIAGAAAAADALENRALLAVLAHLQAVPAATLRRLQRATWAKWLALALYLLLFIPFFWSLGTFARVIAVVSGLSVLLALGAVAVRPAPSTSAFRIIEAFALSQLAAIGLIVVFTWVHTWWL